MQTVRIDISDDKLEAFLTIVKNLKSDIVKGIKIESSLDIEPIEKDSADYVEILNIKNENNKKYSIDEVKTQLGL